MEGTISTNGQETNAALIVSQHIGDPDHHAGAGIYGSSNLFSGPLSTGAFMNYSKNQHTLSVVNSYTPGLSSTLAGIGSINLHQDAVHRVDANAFHSATKLNNGFKYNNTGAGLNYSHANGHSVGVSAGRIPQVGGTTVGINGTANLWKSPGLMTRLDLTAGLSRIFGGLFNGEKNNSLGIGITGRF